MIRESMVVVIVYLAALFYLRISFPKTMLTLYALFWIVMTYLMKTAPYDHEFWPGLHKEASIS